MDELTPSQSLELAVSLYSLALPSIDTILNHAQQKNRWIRFSAQFYELTQRLKCENYPILYQDEALLNSALIRSLGENNKKINCLFSELTVPFTAGEISAVMDAIFSKTNKLAQAIEHIMQSIEQWDFPDQVQITTQEKWDSHPSEAQQEKSNNVCEFFAFIVATFYDLVALMVHGRKLTTLVSEAILGNDESFHLAVHIDRNILNHIPYFKDRYLLAQQQGDENFLSALNYRTQSPQFKGNITYKRLYLLFYFLEKTQSLDQLPYKKIVEICLTLNIEDPKEPINSEKVIGERLKLYRTKQKIKLKSTQ